MRTLPQLSGNRTVSQQLKNCLTTLLKNRAYACVLSAILPIAFRLCLLPWMPVPEPAVHDEFANLLGAETFASGRLTNPPHPFWQHFEVFHLLQQPTYASKYPPMQSVVLAVGEKFGYPWIGVLLSVGAMCAAICWALQGCVSTQVSLVGSLIVGVRLGVFSYWVNSYWGGAVAATGGALVIGAFLRFLRQPRKMQGFVLASGLAILANSRPYEGLVLAISVVAVMIFKAHRGGTTPILIRMIAMPMLIVLIPTAAAMGYYNFRVTKNAFLFPHVLYDRQYGFVSSFLWLPPARLPSYRNPAMTDFAIRFELESLKAARSSVVSHIVRTVAIALYFTVIWSPIALLVLAPQRSSAEADRTTLFILLVSLVFLDQIMYVQAHYVAPILGVILARCAMAMDLLRHWQIRKRPVGAVLVGCLVGLMLLDPLLHSSDLETPGFRAPYYDQFKRDRKVVISELNQHPGEHLVFVRYSKEHIPHCEWVYNGANIDSARIVFARDLGDSSNLALARYASQRMVWVLKPDVSPPELSPYPGLVATHTHERPSAGN